MKNTAKGWLVTLLLGISCGTIFFYLLKTLPSKYADMLFYLFGLQYLVAALVVDNSSIYYLLFSILHFIIIFRLCFWLVRKELSVRQWALAIFGYLIFSISIFIGSAYIFFHYVMRIGETISQ